MNAEGKILTTAQAGAVYSAMCALNNVGAKLHASLYERAQRVDVREAGGFICVEVDGKKREVFESQDVFAMTYGLQKG